MAPRGNVSLFFQLLQASCLLGLLAPSLLHSSFLQLLPLIPVAPSYKAPYDAIEPTGIIQDNFSISVSLMSAKSFLSRKEEYSQVPAIRMWSSPGGGALFCLLLLLWTWFCQPLSTSSSPSSTNYPTHSSHIKSPEFLPENPLRKAFLLHSDGRLSIKTNSLLWPSKAIYSLTSVLSLISRQTGLHLLLATVVVMSGP